LKKFDYQLTAGHCKPCGKTISIYIYTKALKPRLPSPKNKVEPQLYLQQQVQPQLHQQQQQVEPISNHVVLNITNTNQNSNKKATKWQPGKPKRWETHKNMDMCGQGDIEIIPEWRKKYTIEDLKQIVEQKGYSAISVGSFGHAALKKFDYQLNIKHCKPTKGYTNEIWICNYC